MTSWADLLSNLLAGLRSPAKAALTTAVQRAERNRSGPEEVESLRSTIESRLATIDQERTELGALAARLEHLSGIMRYLPEGWPESRDRLRSALAADPLAGIADWLEFWFAAAAEYRLDALDMLTEDVSLPSGAAEIARRAAAAAHGLRSRGLDAAAFMLSAGRSGLPLGDRCVPKPETRQALGLLLIRLALFDGRTDKAEEELRRLDADTVSAAKSGALRAAVVAIEDPALAEKLILEASRLDPEDLDVCAELVRQSRPAGVGSRSATQLDVALDLARPGIDAMGSLVDVDSELNRLVDCPPELWIAVAERAIREGDDPAALQALDTALTSDSAQEQELLVLIDQLRLKVIKDPVARREALIEAGQTMIDAGYVERALELMREARDISLDPDPDPALHAAAVARWADCVAVVAQDMSLSLVRADVEEALRLVLEAQDHLDLAGPDSWSYLTEVQLRLKLSQAIEPARVGQQWSALLAACRAVAVTPGARRWAAVSDVAQEMAAFQLGELAGRAAFEWGGPDWAPTYARALMNNGKPDEALQVIASATDPWSECVRGYASLLQGQPDDAVKVLGSVDIDASWAWAGQALVLAIALAGDVTRSVERARQLEPRVRSDADDYDAVYNKAWGALLQDDLARAANLAARLVTVDSFSGRTDAAQILGEALILSGELEAGHAALRDYIEASTSPWGLMGWAAIDGPYLKAAAAASARDPGDLAQIGILAHERLEMLTSLTLPGELTLLPASGTDPAVIERTKSYSGLLSALAMNDRTRMAEVYLALASIGENVPATPWLDAASASTDNTDDVLEGGDEFPIMVRLPASWFEDFADPVHEHPLFTRFLPELRAAAPSFVPPIKVSADRNLEPDRYEIFGGDKLLGNGVADPSHLYVAEETRALLGPDTSVESGSADQAAALFSPSGYELITAHLASISRELDRVDMRTPPPIDRS